jgi:hypothetical protein
MFSWLLLILVLIYKWFASKLKYESIVAHDPIPLLPIASHVAYEGVGITVSSTVYEGTIAATHLKFTNPSPLLSTKCSAFLESLEQCGAVQTLKPSSFIKIVKELMKEHIGSEDLDAFKQFIAIPENRVICVNWLVCYFLNPKNIKDLNSLLDTSELKKQFLEEIGAFVRISDVLNIKLVGSPKGADNDVFIQISPDTIQGGYMPTVPMVHPDDIQLLLKISGIDDTKPLSCTYYCSDGKSVTHTSCGHPFVVQWLLSLPTTGTTTPIFPPFTAPQLVALIAIRIEHIADVLQKKDITRSTDLKGHPILENAVYINKLVKLLIHTFFLMQGVQCATKYEHYTHFLKFQDKLGADSTCGVYSTYGAKRTCGSDSTYGAKETSDANRTCGAKGTSDADRTYDLLPALKWVLSHHKEGDSTYVPELLQMLIQYIAPQFPKYYM